MAETPHSIHKGHVPARASSGRKYVQPLDGQPEVPEKSAAELRREEREKEERNAIDRLKRGETVLLTRSTKDIWAWASSARPLPKWLLKKLRADENLVEVEPPLIAGELGQVWGYPR